MSNPLDIEIGFWLSLWAFILGACLGSFYLVCIQRYLASQNIGGRSHCPNCQKQLSALELIPLFSYFLQKGRCKNCQQKIAFAYPLAELISGLLALLLINHYGLGLDFFVILALTGVFFIASGIDLYAYIIPDKISLSLPIPALLIGIYILQLSPLDSILGGLVAVALFYGLILFFRKFRHIEAMGFGDVKLVLSLGFLCGLTKLFIMLFISSVSGIIFGLFWIYGKSNFKESPIPFGPLLCLGCLITILYADELLIFLYG